MADLDIFEGDDLTPAEVFRIGGEIIAAHVANNPVPINDLPQLIANVQGALKVAAELAGMNLAEEPKPEPVISARASVKPDHITCMDCGAKLKLLKKHLLNVHGMTPADYREKWGLTADYPMVSPNYSEDRRAMAVKLGLGHHPGAIEGRKKGQQTNKRRTLSVPPKAAAG